MCGQGKQVWHVSGFSLRSQDGFLRSLFRDPNTEIVYQAIRRFLYFILIPRSDLGRVIWDPVAEQSCITRL